MPIPYDIECNESMSYAYAAKAAIVAALERVTGLADDETWSGTPAENWMTDLTGHVQDALSALGAPLDTAAGECRRYAQHLKAQSMQNATTPGS